MTSTRVAGIGVVLATVAGIVTVSGGQLPSARITGRTLAGLSHVDRHVQAVMGRWNLPGGQLAIAIDGRLVASRGYGFADVEQAIPVEPTTLFRVGSVSKVLTTLAILRAVDAGRLRLDDRVFRLLASRDPTYAPTDPRANDITVTHLLQHRGGWAQRDWLELPWSRQAATALTVDDPPTCAEIARHAVRSSARSSLTC